MKVDNKKFYKIGAGPTVVLSDLGLHFDHPDVLSRFEMLLTAPATIGEAEESSRSSNSKDHLDVLR